MVQTYVICPDPAGGAGAGPPRAAGAGPTGTAAAAARRESPRSARRTTFAVPGVSHADPPPAVTATDIPSFIVGATGADGGVDDPPGPDLPPPAFAPAAD